MKICSIDAKGLVMAQLIWLSDCPIKGYFRAKGARNGLLCTLICYTVYMLFRFSLQGNMKLCSNK